MQKMEFLPLGFAAGFVLVLMIAVIFFLRRSRSKLTLPRVAKDIAFEWKRNLVLPDGYDGEIQIDHLMLTNKGLLVLEVKEVVGNIFGGDRTDEWTVIASNGRYTFRNPQGMLFDKVAAVQRHVPEVPVTGYILFTDQAHFGKGRPQGVMTLAELDEEYSPGEGTDRVLDAFRPHWERLLSIGHSAV
jgi:hypothetical protein